MSCSSDFFFDLLSLITSYFLNFRCRKKTILRINAKIFNSCILFIIDPRPPIVDVHMFFVYLPYLSHFLCRLSPPALARNSVWYTCMHSVRWQMETSYNNQQCARQQQILTPTISFSELNILIGHRIKRIKINKWKRNKFGVESDLIASTLAFSVENCF